MLKEILSYLIILMFSILAQIYVQTISGKVQDSDSGQALYVAHVHLLQAGSNDVTNRSGEFTVRVSEGFDDSLRVSFIGYETFTAALADFEGDGMISGQTISQWNTLRVSISMKKYGQDRYR